MRVTRIVGVCKIAPKLSDLKIFPNKWIVFCDACGLLVWTYVVLKVFAFDVDNVLISKTAPQLEWLSTFRFVLFVAVAGLLAIVVGRKRFLGLCLYVLAFPIILMAWKVTFLVIRTGSWTFGLAFLNWFMSLFSDLTYKVVSVAAYSAASSLILFSTSTGWIIAGMVLMVLAVIASFVRSAINSFRAPRVLALYRRFFGFLAKGRDDFKTEEAGPRGTKVGMMPAEHRKKYATTLQTRILLNRGALFFATKLSEYQRSQAIALSGVATTLHTIILSVVAFSVLYYGAGRVSPNSIIGAADQGAFDYLYLSFSNMIFSEVDGVTFGDVVSKALSMLQKFLSFTMLGIFLGIIISIRGRKYEQELEDTITDVRAAGKTFEKSIVKYYSYRDIDDAIEDIQKIQGDLADFIVRISAGIKP